MDNGLGVQGSKEPLMCPSCEICGENFRRLGQRITPTYNIFPLNQQHHTSGGIEEFEGTGHSVTIQGGFPIKFRHRFALSLSLALDTETLYILPNAPTSSVMGLSFETGVWDLAGRSNHGFFNPHRTHLVMASVSPSILHSGRVEGWFPALVYTTVRAQENHPQRTKARKIFGSDLHESRI
ncbi:hypothetical protein BDN67DRAFT_1002106 [Paxillus ammoniavirescens]|nr:hypothetical protein BDN67DRAFT_1002106 [Paxillus ammoniavirescens]